MHLFTRIELLTIVCLSMIMATVMTASLNDASKHKAECQNNLRRLGQAQQLFTAEHNGKMACSVYELQPQLGFRKSDIPAVTGCPAVPVTQRRKVFYGAEYGKNMIAFVPEKFWRPKKTWKSEKGDLIRNELKLYSAPGKTMMLMDFPPEPKGGLCSVGSHSKFLKTKDISGFRHEKSLNILFMDGHVENHMDVPTAKDGLFWGVK